jgi:DNA-binding protein HU-beta
MDEAELCRRVAGHAKQDEVIVREVLRGLTALVEEQLLSGRALRIPGLVTFTLKIRSSRRARNPKTGGEVTLPGVVVAVASADAALRETVKVHLDPSRFLEAGREMHASITREDGLSRIDYSRDPDADPER